MSKDIFYIRGVAHWAKVIGEPRKNNFDDFREWTIDVSPDEESVGTFKNLGVADRLRTPKSGDNRAPFYTFKQKEFRPDGTKNLPIKVLDSNDQPWPEGRLIGNGTAVDVKFKFQPASGTKKAGLYIRSIRVLDLVKYEASEFPPLSEDDKYFAAPASSEAPEFKKDFGLTDDDLDDDIPSD